jgi:hypothetical protein
MTPEISNARILLLNQLRQMEKCREEGETSSLTSGIEALKEVIRLTNECLGYPPEYGIDPESPKTPVLVTDPSLPQKVLQLVEAVNKSMWLLASLSCPGMHPELGRCPGDRMQDGEVCQELDRKEHCWMQWMAEQLGWTTL